MPPMAAVRLHGRGARAATYEIKPEGNSRRPPSDLPLPVRVLLSPSVGWEKGHSHAELPTADLLLH